MNKQVGLVKAAVVSLLFCVAVLPASAGDVVFGYSLDGRPVSYTQIIQGNKTGKVLGFCGHLFDGLSQQGYTLSPLELAFDQRFGQFAKGLAGRAGIQCGPSSRTRLRELDLRSDTDGYSGEFSRPFFVTTSKLLVRTTRLDALYSHPEALRIGVLKSPEGKPPVTTSVIEEIFPTARIVGLSSRTEAVERLELGMALPDAIDAYAADEVLLDDILNHDIPADMRGEYSIEPPIHGYSREEYVVVVYNAPQLTAKVNAWLATPAGKAAAAQLVVETDAMAQGLHWLARGDHLAVARLLSNWLAFAGFVVLVLLLWRRRKRVAVAGEPEPVPLFPAIPSNPDEMSGRALLTARETEVLILLIKGNSSKETARDLDLSPRTVEAHRKNIYTKLGANTPLELVEYARKQGLV